MIGHPVRRPPRENSVLDAVTTFLARHGGKTLKTHGSAWGNNGNPDLVGYLRGRMLELELKRPGEEPEPLQQVELDRWARTGAITGCIHSVAELEALLAAHLGVSWKTSAPGIKLSEEWG